MGTISTNVRPVTVEMAESLLESNAVFRNRFGLDVAEGYLAFPEALPDEWAARLRAAAATLWVPAKRPGAGACVGRVGPTVPREARCSGHPEGPPSQR